MPFLGLTEMQIYSAVAKCITVFLAIRSFALESDEDMFTESFQELNHAPGQSWVKVGAAGLESECTPQDHDTRYDEKHWPVEVKNKRFCSKKSSRVFERFWTLRVEQ